MLRKKKKDLRVLKSPSFATKIGQSNRLIAMVIKFVLYVANQMLVKKTDIIHFIVHSNESRSADREDRFLRIVDLRHEYICKSISPSGRSEADK